MKFSSCKFYFTFRIGVTALITKEHTKFDLHKMINNSPPPNFPQLLVDIIFDIIIICFIKFVMHFTQFFLNAQIYL